MTSATTDLGQEDLAAATLAKIDAIFDGRPVEIDGQTVNPSLGGEVYAMLSQAVEHRSAVVDQARSDLAVFRAKLEQFRVSPAVMVTADWTAAVSSFFADERVEVFFQPTGTDTLELVINHDPAIVADRDAASPGGGQRGREAGADEADGRVPLRDRGGAAGGPELTGRGTGVRSIMNQHAESSRGTPVVACQNLTKVFRDFWMRNWARAVDSLSFDIHPHEIFGLLGPNGSGKSTTIKVILGSLCLTRGRVAVFGKPPTDVATKKRIGYLPEESYLYPFLNARETLDYYGKLFEIGHQVRPEPASTSCWRWSG